MERKAVFPTDLHATSAELIRDYFLNEPSVDSVLVVNSCARGTAVPESDLDFAILMKPGTNADQLTEIEYSWHRYSQANSTIIEYKHSGPFAHLHLDLIDGVYLPMEMGNGEPIDYFEIQIGNQICYSAPMGGCGSHFEALQSNWLPYHKEELRLKRLQSVKDACNYDLDHIPFLTRRQLYFHAFDVLYKAFQEYLQALFIANQTYPIAYNKWIKEQVATWLDKPLLYAQLAPLLSVQNLESNEVNDKARELRKLLSDLP